MDFRVICATVTVFFMFVHSVKIANQTLSNQWRKSENKMLKSDFVFYTLQSFHPQAMMNEAKAHKNDIYSIISCAETELVRILPEGTERCKNCFALDLLSRSGFF